MKKINILFVCKYNRFRSRVAEAYFKKINRNKKISASSAGLIQGFFPLDKDQVRIAKNDFGININGKPRAMSMNLLKKQDMIIVIADDVPRNIFNYKWYKDRIFSWKIRDNNDNSTDKEIRKTIMQIIKKIDDLNNKLEKAK